MRPERDATDLFSEMTLELHRHFRSPERTTDEIVEWAKQAAGCADAGIMLVRSRDDMETAVATSHRVAQAHDLQIALNEGPCLDAIKDGSTYLTGEVTDDDRFPRWGPAVADLGFRSVLSVLLATDERRYGSLNLYAEEPHSFNEDDHAVTQIFARHASVALAVAHHHHGLESRLDARKLIGQAQGILMQRFDIDADRAFDFMRRQSQDRNIKLRVIADAVVNHRGDLDSLYHASEGH